MRQILLLILFVVFLQGCLHPQDYCVEVKDCQEAILMHDSCIGEWSCETNSCKWICDQRIINESKKTVFDLDQKDDLDKTRLNDTLVADENSTFVEFMDRVQCLEYGGYWNECASTCRNSNGTFCVEVCEEICMCGTDDKFRCPPGYGCKIYDQKEQAGECILKS